MDSLLFVFFCLLLSSFINVSLAASFQRTASPSTTYTKKVNPYTAKASLIRYWNNHISNNLTKPSFLLSKSSPLNALDLAFLTKLAARNNLSSHLSSFCAAANLFCHLDSEPAIDTRGHIDDANFAAYSSKGFTNYGRNRVGGVDSFKNYSDGENLPTDSFRRYSHGSSGHDERFANYAPDTNVATGTFATYATGAAGGSGEFRNYDWLVNGPDLKFTTYNSDANSHKLTFSSYSNQANTGSQGFTNYGKSANSGPTEFSNYGGDSNVVGSTFTGYGDSGNTANDIFKAYGDSGNVPNNNFKHYGEGGNSGRDTFSSYRDKANVGDDSFQSYAKNSKSGTASFANYGKSFKEGSDVFAEYGKGSVGHLIEFKIYGVNNTFKDYARKGVTFAQYTNSSANARRPSRNSGSFANRWVEPGKFFRESMLREGNVVVMPDIRDRLPQRSFLPRTISSKLPFSSSSSPELKQIFQARENSAMERVIDDALAECERAPSPGETKRCVSSIEDMIDFATLVLGRNVSVRTTENVSGSKNMVKIGSVRGINGGEVTKSVSCHQSMFPYLLYYCHSVPKVRVYEADILDVESTVKINHGVAICHVDTSAWGRGHGAFVALGSGPGLIEVCHWIFENDMTWTTAY